MGEIGPAELLGGQGSSMAFETALVMIDGSESPGNLFGRELKIL